MTIPKQLLNHELNLILRKITQIETLLQKYGRKYFVNASNHMAGKQEEHTNILLNHLLS